MDCCSNIHEELLIIKRRNETLMDQSLDLRITIRKTDNSTNRCFGGRGRMPKYEKGHIE